MSTIRTRSSARAWCCRGRPRSQAFPSDLGTSAGRSGLSVMRRTSKPEKAATALVRAVDFVSVRAQSRALAAPLSPEDCAIQSMPDASPVKWHLAHTTWFFETFVLLPHLPGYRPYDPAYRMLF